MSLIISYLTYLIKSLRKLYCFGVKNQNAKMVSEVFYLSLHRDIMRFKHVGLVLYLHGRKQVNEYVDSADWKTESL